MLDTTRGPAALDAISGQPLANFGTTTLTASYLFLKAFESELLASHGGPAGGARVSMAASADGTCDFACDAPAAKYEVWPSGVGNIGSVQGDGNASTLTYNFGGTVVGADYRIDPQLLVGVGGGWVSGTQWVNGFAGQGNVDSFSGFLYGSYTPGPLYLDGAVGYVNSNERMNRVIAIPGLNVLTAQDHMQANEFMGQLETGYRLALPMAKPATVTPFARLQGATIQQGGFTESGANSLDLVVDQQTTNSLRSTLGADLAATFDVGGEHSLDLAFRLGWLHEYADTTRPLTAAFAGAPGSSFTVVGATPQRDSAVIALAAGARVTDAATLYARYDGEIGNGADNHAITAGLRISW
jgi:outer membrane autotransporter protein